MEQRSDDNRVSIWSVESEDLKFYSKLFPLLTISGILFYGICFVNWDNKLVGLWNLISNIGSIGISAAVISLLILVIWRI